MPIKQVLTRDYMIRFGETASGKIIEVPDVAIAMLVVFIIVSIFAMSMKNDSWINIRNKIL